MELEFLGTGNALDTQRSNCAYMLHGPCNLLVDCGYDTPRRLFESQNRLESLDGLYLTHMHGDHSFGFPFLVLALGEQKRSRPLHVIGQPGTKDFLLELLRMAYPSVPGRLSFELNFIETTERMEFRGLKLSFARTSHGRSNYAVKIEHGDTRIGISGDGGLTEETRELFMDCRLLVHDTFTLEAPHETHEAAVNVVRYCESCPELRTLACVHLDSALRTDARRSDFLTLAAGRHFSIIVPEPGERWSPA